MKIDLAEINRENFFVDEHIIAGEPCYLVHPRPNYFDWEPSTLHLRSSVWNAQGEPVSLGFRKFFNFEEKPTIEPFDSTKGFVAVEKLDGSLLVVSRYKGQTIFRTRGTVDASKHDNGNDLEGFKAGVLKEWLHEFEKEYTQDHSVLFEWFSPSNKIVLSYGEEPKLTLLNIVDHDGYTLWDCSSLWEVARRFDFEFPRAFHFAGVPDMLRIVPEWVGQEGVCIYYNGRNSIRKVKSKHYLKLHAFKSQCTPKAIATLIAEWDPSSLDSFLKLVEEQFDFECMEECKPTATVLWDVWFKLLAGVREMKEFAVKRSTLVQKDFAIALQTAVKDTSLHQFAYQIRKGEIKEGSIAKAFLNRVEAIGEVCE